MLPSMDERFDPTRPFRRRDGLAAGLTAGELRGPRFRRVATGVYVAAEVAALPLVRAQAVTLLFPGRAIASHATAARVHGAPLPPLPEEHVTVLRPADRRYHAGVRAHVARTSHVVDHGGILVSSINQTFVELAELLGLVDLVVVGDHWVRQRRTTPEQLVSFCARSKHRRARAAQDAAAYVREGVDSPMETRLRLLIVLAGLPEPTVNLVLRDEYGEPIRQHDLAYEHQRLAIDYDGRHHVELIEEWEKDLKRREAMDDDAWRSIRVVASGIYRDPEQTLRRIHRIARLRGVPGVPERLRDGWRAHFPGRS
jgi:hypothetical protein